MDSDVSEIPSHRSHNPIPLKKRYNWSQFLANAVPRRPPVASEHCSRSLPVHPSHQIVPTTEPQTPSDGSPPDFRTLDSTQLRSLQLLNDPYPVQMPQQSQTHRDSRQEQETIESLQKSTHTFTQLHTARNILSGRTVEAIFPPKTSQSCQDTDHASSTKSVHPAENKRLVKHRRVPSTQSAHPAENSRPVNHRRHRESEEVRRKHAKEWILKNDRALLPKASEEDEDEIYLNINGRQYVARPVERDAIEGPQSRKEEWHRPAEQTGGPSLAQTSACRSKSTAIPLKQDTLLCGNVPPDWHPELSSYDAEAMCHWLSRAEELPVNESLEQIILKDKLAILSQMQQMTTRNLATVPVERRDPSSEVYRKEHDQMDQLERIGYDPSLIEPRCTPRLESPHTSLSSSYPGCQRLPLPPMRALIPQQIGSPRGYPSPQISSAAPSHSPAPSTTSLPLSPAGSFGSSSERLAEASFTSATKFGNSPDSTSNIQGDHEVASPTTSVSSNTTGGVTQGGVSSSGDLSPEDEAMSSTTKGLSTVPPNIPDIKVEPDPECSSDSPRVKRPVDNKCPVCGDVVSGYHYGIYSCESCKGFFKRTVQNKRNERLHCARDGNCEMNLRSRKHCASCRFQKCVDQGMQLQAIRGNRQRGGRSMYEGSSEYRRRLLLQIQQQKTDPAEATTKRKRRQSKGGRPAAAGAKPREGGCESQVPIKEEPHPPQDPSLYSRVPAEEEELDLQEHVPQLISELLSQSAFLLVHPLADCCRPCSLTEEGIFRDICHLVNHHLAFLFEWTQGLPYFRELEKEDQHFIYKNRWIPLMLTHYCLSLPGDPTFIQLRDNRVIDLERVVESANFVDFVKNLKDIVAFFVELKLDPVECAVLRLLVLLNSDVAINQPSRMMHFQERVQDTLIFYVLSKDPKNARRVGDILLRFAEIEKLCFLIHEQLTFRYLGGQLSEFGGLCEILKTE